MKTALKIVIMLCLINGHGQNVKVKKDILSIEKQAVCKFYNPEHNHYEIQDLDGKPIFNIEFESETITSLEGEEQFEFLKFTRPDDPKVYYSDYDLTDLKMSFSGEKTLIRHLIKKNGFLSESGINYNKVQDFFSRPRPRSKTLEEKVAQYKEAYKYVEDFNLKFNGNKILKTGKKDTLVGSYKIGHNMEPGFTTIYIYDAKAFQTATYTAGTISLFDGNRIKYGTLSRDENENARKVIKRMIIAGYTLGDMQTKKANIRIKNHRKEVRSEMETSVNIYNRKATVYDAEGNTIDGEITLEFYELESNKSGMSSLKNYGGVATLKTTKENGKYKYTDYKAKDHVRICLKSSKECYQGISTKGMTGPKFNLEVDVTGNLKLYKSKSFSYYVIKKEDVERGLIVSSSALFKSDNSGKMFESIYEYLSDCPGLKDNLNTSEIDLKNEEDLKKIIKTYNNCK